MSSAKGVVRILQTLVDTGKHRSATNQLKIGLSTLKTLHSVRELQKISHKKKIDLNPVLNCIFCIVTFNQNIKFWFLYISEHVFSPGYQIFF